MRKTTMFNSFQSQNLYHCICDFTLTVMKVFVNLTSRTTNIFFFHWLRPFDEILFCFLVEKLLYLGEKNISRESPVAKLNLLWA